MSDNILDWLSLARSKGIKNETLRSAIDQYGYDPVVLKEKIIIHAKNANCFDKIKFNSNADSEKELYLTQQYGAKIIPISSPEYPIMLKEVYNAPLVITVKGNKGLLNKKAIAVVGARKPAFHSQEIALEISAELSNHFLVVSGMATGIDASAHVGGLRNNMTAAVLGSGINVIYPTENVELYHELCQKAIIITQYPFGTTPRPGNFPLRNQIIAGMSLGVVVIEAYRNTETGRSGSLITAEFAKSINRTIYTIPGFPTKDGRFAGNNYLLKEHNAVLIENAKDIINHIKHNDNIAKEEKKVINLAAINITIDEIREAKFKIMSTLHSIPVSINEIAVATNLPIETIRACIIELEMSDIIIRTFDNKIIPGNYNP